MIRRVKFSFSCPPEFAAALDAAVKADGRPLSWFLIAVLGEHPSVKRELRRAGAKGGTDRIRRKGA